MLSANDFEELRELAESAAAQAGRLLVAHRAHLSDAEMEIGHDIKIRGDKAAEALISRLLRKGSSYSIYGEESGLIGPAGGDLVWVVDPLDGTANYARGVPACCVSIALCLHGVSVLGVVYDFNRDEMFSGVEVGAIGLRSASMNGQGMRVSDTSSAGNAILATGFPVASDFESEALSDYVLAVQDFRKVRSLGTAALMVAYVACGRFDAYTERNVRFWDIAAGIALVRAAGGQVVETSAEPGFDRRLQLNAWNGLFDFA
jgi:myo-inositol-1(or 4)-monophosphatase